MLKGCISSHKIMTISHMSEIIVEVQKSKKKEKYYRLINSKIDWCVFYLCRISNGGYAIFTTTTSTHVLFK